MARKIYAAPSSLLRHRSFRNQAKIGMNEFKDNKKVAGMEKENSDGGMGDVMLMVDLRKKILTFRNAIAFPHCDNYAPIAELIRQTLEDLNQLNPAGIHPDVKEVKGITLQQELFYLYEALKIFGDKWNKIPMCSTCSIRGRSGSVHVGGHVTQKLDSMIKAARQNGSFADVSKSLPPLLKAAQKCISLNICRPLTDGSPSNDQKKVRTQNLKKAKSSSAIETIASKEVSVSGSPKSVLLINHETNASERIKAKRTTQESISSQAVPSISVLPTKSSKTEPKPEPEQPRESVATVPSREPSKTNGTAPSGPPPPPPPRAGGGSRVLTLKRSDSKLKRSSHMGNLYRSLKRKLEGGSKSNASSGSKSNKGSSTKLGGDGNAKQGWAEALAEIARRSSYFHQIEEDVQKHSQMILKLKGAINSFKTKDMAELVKFHSQVEQQLEQLSDESQVLARFEDFPTKKLESLRAAAALYLKLDGISEELKNWKIEPPMNQLLDKIEKYFAKIKGIIEGLERTKDDDAKQFKNHDIDFDFNILLRIKELMVDVSSSSMELALEERRKVDEGKKVAHIRIQWRAFQLAYRVYTFAGGQDDRADRLTQELGQALDASPQR